MPFGNIGLPPDEKANTKTLAGIEPCAGQTRGSEQIKVVHAKAGDAPTKLTLTTMKQEKK
jgi:hypothetical protein